MDKQFTVSVFKSIIALFLWLSSALQVFAQTHDVNITIHLRGVYESKISLMGLSGTKAYKTITEQQGIKNGETAILQVPMEYLPGEFVLRFDY